MFFGIGAYCSTILQVRYGVNPWIGLVASAASGGVLGFSVGFLSFRAGLKGPYFALITVAFAEILRILANSFAFTGGGVGLLVKVDPGLSNLQFVQPAPFLYITALLFVASVGFVTWLQHSKFGLRLAAISENEDAASALGINVFRQKLAALAISGSLCAIGGTVYVQKYLYIDPWIAFGADKSVEMLLVSIVGGAGTALGPLLGSIFIHCLNEATRLLSDAQGLSLVFYGSVLVIVIGFLPEGMLGLLQSVKQQWLGRVHRRRPSSA
jgi:branched-chain amino acid transport system permease protein